MTVPRVLFASRDDQDAVRHGDVGGLVALQLVVAPAGYPFGRAVARLDVPPGSIQGRAVELVGPDEYPALAILAGLDVAAADEG